MLPYEKRMQNREVLIKQEAETNPLYGKNPNNRDIKELLEASIVNINKPKGPTSHEVSEYVKKILHVKKAGQSGTLDPAVTGVLPIGINRGTKALQALLKAGKEYVCLMHVHKDHSEEEIRNVCKEFVGVIKQLPPIKSAVKRQWRMRRIYYLDILEIKGQDVLFRVGCQAGTYIRKLCSDIGDKLGSGAHMAQLVRTQVGMFTDNDMVTLQDLSDAYEEYTEGDEAKITSLLQPIEKIVEHLPKVYVTDSTVKYMCNGMNLAMPGIAKIDSDIEPDEIIAIMTLKGELIALGSANVNAKVMLESDSGIAVKTEFVLMDPTTYPKIQRD